MSTKYNNIKKFVTEEKPGLTEEQIQPEAPEQKNEFTSLEEPKKEKVATKPISTKTMPNQQVKKTYEINLTYEIALEMLRNERKQQKRFVNTEKATTSNGIINEMLAEFFNKKENKKYLENALEMMLQS